MNFSQLHQQASPLLIANVWDAPSAKAAEKLNFKAIGTSSSAIAALLGYNDGEEMSFSELAYIVKRIAQSSNLPLSVDLEGGYSRQPGEIADHIKQLAALGVHGVNIEDSVVEEARVQLNAEAFAAMLSEVKDQLEKDQVEVFINVRTDAFLLGQADAVENTKQRIQLYEQAGANGIFTPCMVNESDIEVIVNCTTLPINVMCMPKLPDFETLGKLGVSRISMGNFLFGKMCQQYEKMLGDVFEQNSFNPVFEK